MSRIQCILIIIFSIFLGNTPGQSQIVTTRPNINIPAPRIPKIFSSTKSIIVPDCKDADLGGPGHGAPEHTKILLSYNHPNNRDERYDFRWIKVIPLNLNSNTTFRKSYPGLALAHDALRLLLKSRPTKIDFKKEIPVWDHDDIEQTIHSKFQYIDTPEQSGMLFVNHDTYDMSNPITNTEIYLIYQGISTDGNYFISAWFNISNSILNGFDNETYLREYLKLDAIQMAQKTKEIGKQLDDLPNSSFHPSIDDIITVIKSIRFK